MCGDDPVPHGPVEDPSEHPVGAADIGRGHPFNRDVGDPFSMWPGRISRTLMLPEGGFDPQPMRFVVHHCGGLEAGDALDIAGPPLAERTIAGPVVDREPAVEVGSLSVQPAAGRGRGGERLRRGGE